MDSRHARRIDERPAHEEGQRQRGHRARHHPHVEVIGRHDRLLLSPFRASVSGLLAPCDSPYVLVLYITTTPTQKQAPNPKKVAGALQFLRGVIRERGGL